MGKGLHRSETVQAELHCSNNTALILTVLAPCFFPTLSMTGQPGQGRVGIPGLFITT